MKFVRNEGGNTPVSYTHLDVYKRQVILRRSMGLTAFQKFSAQLLVTGLFAHYLTDCAPAQLLRCV